MGRWGKFLPLLSFLFHPVFPSQTRHSFRDVQSCGPFGQANECLIHQTSHRLENNTLKTRGIL